MNFVEFYRIPNEREARAKNSKSSVPCSKLCSTNKKLHSFKEVYILTDMDVYHVSNIDHIVGHKQIPGITLRERLCFSITAIDELQALVLSRSVKVLQKEPHPRL